MAHVYRVDSGENSAGASPGSLRDEQQKNLEKTSKSESWLRMLLRRRRETLGKPKRSSPYDEPSFRRPKQE